MAEFGVEGAGWRVRGGESQRRVWWMAATSSPTLGRAAKGTRSGAAEQVGVSGPGRRVREETGRAARPGGDEEEGAEGGDGEGGGHRRGEVGRRQIWGRWGGGGGSGTMMGVAEDAWRPPERRRRGGGCGREDDGEFPWRGRGSLGSGSNGSQRGTWRWHFGCKYGSP